MIYELIRILKNLENVKIDSIKLEKNHISTWTIIRYEFFNNFKIQFKEAENDYYRKEVIKRDLNKKWNIINKLIGKNRCEEYIKIINVDNVKNF